jgi:hypothetical protein
MLIATLGVGASAQEISPYSEYKIRQGVTIEVQDVQRVEKYGWDNLEVTYRLKNNTEYNLFKVDLTFYLIDKHDEQVGIVYVHDFKVPKNSDKLYKFVDIHSPYVNEKYDKIIVVKNNLEVMLEDDGSKLALINCAPDFRYK